ncbi:hypothetical protein SESBI_48518 [Sesbania bispinosa]|nr:hypothetical protein SESBI_48518 [Sesbania bispinosa]
MATSLKSRREFVLFLIILTLVVASSEARLVPQFATMGRKANLELRLRELINNMRNSESHTKRSMLGARVERVSPEGPDSQHH